MINHIQLVQAVGTLVLQGNRFHVLTITTTTTTIGSRGNTIYNN